MSMQLDLLSYLNHQGVNVNHKAQILPKECNNEVKQDGSWQYITDGFGYFVVEVALMTLEFRFRNATVLHEVKIFYTICFYCGQEA